MVINSEINQALLKSISGLEVKKNGRPLNRQTVKTLDGKDFVKVTFYLLEDKALNIQRSGKYKCNITVDELNIYLNLGVEII